MSRTAVLGLCRRRGGDFVQQVVLHRGIPEVHGLGGGKSARLGFYEFVVSGDSGNPRFLVIRDHVVLVSVLHYGGAGSGCFVSHYANEIRQAMNSLCQGYQLEEEVLDDYEALDQQ